MLQQYEHTCKASYKRVYVMSPFGAASFEAFSTANTAWIRTSGEKRLVVCSSVAVARHVSHGRMPDRLLPCLSHLHGWSDRAASSALPRDV